MSSHEQALASNEWFGPETELLRFDSIGRSDEQTRSASKRNCCVKRGLISIGNEKKGAQCNAADKRWADTSRKGDVRECDGIARNRGAKAWK